MQTEIRSIDSIKPYQNNPRHSEAAVDAVAKSIRQFGFQQPIVVDTEDVIAVGHTR
ncbi:MAG: adenine methyltransferase [Phycisphaerae bacterium SM23_33]|nr:MAG: adenine methyltransferase [Phycisphaerae bacterium SM23_33]